MLKKLLLLSLTVISSLLLIACGSEKETVDPNKIAMPISASTSDADYKSVQKQLSDAGFENVTTQKIEDLTLGIFTKDGEVEKVTVKGDDDFSEGDLFDKDVAITIHYHTFKAEEKETEGSGKEDTESTESSSEQTSPSSSKESSESKTEKDETITLDNPEFAYIFNNNDEPKTKEFVEKYRGEIIEFDGHISGMWPLAKYKTRYSISIEDGDWIYEEHTNYRGVPLSFEDVNFNDLNVSSDVSSVKVGDHFHIKAKIVKSGKYGQIIYLEPVELRSR